MHACRIVNTGVVCSRNSDRYSIANLVIKLDDVEKMSQQLKKEAKPILERLKVS